MQCPPGVEGGITSFEGPVGIGGQTSLFDESVNRSLRPVRDVASTQVAQQVRAGNKHHRPDLFGDLSQGHPHGDGVGGVQRPVVLILVPGGVTTPGFLEQRLVVVEPNPFHT